MAANLVANSFVGRVKVIRNRMKTLPISGAGTMLRDVMVDLIDALLLEAGDEFKEEFNGGYVGPLPGSSQHTPLDMSPNVRHMAGAPAIISPTMAPVVMVPAGGEPVHERPQIVRQPEGTPPHVELIQPGSVPRGAFFSAPAPVHVNADIQHLPPGVAPAIGGAPLPATGSVELLPHALPMIPPSGA
jgi:hypothetical protein